MYKEVPSRICVNGELSKTIREGHGMKQGGQMSMEIFLSKSNEMINDIPDILDTMHISAIKVRAPTCADDTCIIFRTHAGARQLY